MPTKVTFPRQRQTSFREAITQKIPTLMEYTSARRYDAFKQLPDHHYFDTSEPCHSCAVISSENARLRGLKLINSFHTWARRQIPFINKIHFCFHMGFAQKHFFIRYNAMRMLHD